MPQSIQSPTRRLAIEPLNPDSFAPFGDVIENPLASSSNLRNTLQSIQANQGSARRWLDITNITNFYSLSPSKKPSRLTASLFACSPRKLRTSEVAKAEDPIRAVPNAYPTSWAQYSAKGSDAGIFAIDMLERHPYTSQTFVPLGLSKDANAAHYLVIVAPTLPSAPHTPPPQRPKPYPAPDPTPRGSASAAFHRARPAPYSNSLSPPPPPSPSRVRAAALPNPKGPGLPDLNNVRVFLASGGQAVTYGAGTWHAPMAVVGQRDVEFVVVQHVSGVAEEDCQEVVLRSDGEGLSVVVEVGGGWVKGRL